MDTARDSKNVTIVVEGSPYDWPKNSDITYAQLVALEFPDFAQHPETTYSIKYTKGQGNKPEGVLVAGGSVKVKDGMIFNVSSTGQS